MLEYNQQIVVDKMKQQSCKGCAQESQNQEESQGEGEY